MSELEKQLHADCDSLREIVAGLDRLEHQLEEARTTIQARQRGYFTPDEDDRVRQLLLAYRNYRLAIHEIVERCLLWETISAPRDQLREFMLGYAAALTLFGKSLRLIELYEHEPLIRKKLNEPDAKFDLESGFFDQILQAYTSLYNYRLLARAGRYWKEQRRDVKRLGLAEDTDAGWLVEV